MRKPSPVSQRRTSPKRSTQLGPGLHGAIVELRSKDRYNVRTIEGERLRAELGAGVDPELVDECMRAGSMVVLAETPDGIAIVGALQRTRSVVRDANDKVTLAARDLKIAADRSLSLEVGPVTLRLDRTGAVRLEGERMVIDMSAIVKVLSARMEIP